MKYSLVLGLFLVILSDCHPSHAPEQNTPEHLIDSSSTDPLTPHQAAAPDFDTSVWQEITARPGLLLDIKYATLENFTKQSLYPCGRCFVRPPVYRNLLEVIDSIRRLNLHLVLLDCYRPDEVQLRLWQSYPDSTYLTPPGRASMHSRGLALDVTLADSLGQHLDMGTVFDEFSPRSRSGYLGLPQHILTNRQLLRQLMILADMHPINSEWWHYSYRQRSAFKKDTTWWPCPGKM